jgi:hypothetical protein
MENYVNLNLRFYPASQKYAMKLWFRDKRQNLIVPLWEFRMRLLFQVLYILHSVSPLKTPFGLLILLLQSQSHVTTITHNYLLRCYAFTQL